MVNLSTAAWFLGSKAENQELFQTLIQEAIASHCAVRKAYFSTDPIYVTPAIQQSPDYQETIAHLKQHYQDLLQQLQGSVPFWSHRWQAHMSWDHSLPSLLGYFVTMLYNPNNVSLETSPVTTQLEIEVGKDLCRLLGYSIPSPEDKTAIHPWGHLTCGGSVANLEALWACRNLKYYPVTIAQALQKEADLSLARGLTVNLPTGQVAPLLDLETWQLLNLEVDEGLSLTSRLIRNYGIAPEIVDRCLKPYGIQALGFPEFYRQFLPDSPAPCLLVPATSHYSWPKAAAILGIGQNQVVRVGVDRRARLEISALETQLEQCWREKRPVLMAVAVMGSTAEGAVDPLGEMLRVRDRYQQRGLTFLIHADAAWGGYFAALLHPEQSCSSPSRLDKSASEREIEIKIPDRTCFSDTQTYSGAEEGEPTPISELSPHVAEQFRMLKRVDSITIDPHKAGYIPKPAGGLCYRNGTLRNLVTMAAPVVYHGGDIDASVGIYGVEGSKPGAVAAAVYLSHRVIPLNRGGYGKILGQCLFNSKRFYAALVTMAQADDPFILVPFHPLPSESLESAPIQAKQIHREIVLKTNAELVANPIAMELLNQLGSDQTIVPYAFNFKLKNGQLNSSLDQANRLNRQIFSCLSLPEEKEGSVPTVPLLVTASKFEPDAYGQPFVDEFARRLGVKPGGDQPIDFLISTTTNPWLTATDRGNFIPELIKILRHTVLQIVPSFQLENSR